MPDYRAYIVGPDGHFKASAVISALDDAPAVEMAAALLTAQDGVEVWLLGRKVAVLAPKTPV